MQPTTKTEQRIPARRFRFFENLSLTQSIVIPTLVLTSLFMGALLLSQAVRSFKELETLYNDQITLLQESFTQNIAQDILLGQFGNVHRRCLEFVHSKLVESVFVRVQNGEVICEGKQSDSTSDEWHRIRTSKVFYSNSSPSEAAEVKVTYSFEDLARSRERFFIFYGTLLGLVFISNILIYFLLRALIVRPLETIRNSLMSPRPKEIFEALGARAFQVKELEGLRIDLIDMSKRLSNFQEQELEIKSQLVAAQVSQQVAHDIRSPLTALNMISSSLKKKSLPESDLLISATQRIQAIADDVLKTARDAVGVAQACKVQDLILDFSEVVDRAKNQFKFNEIEFGYEPDLSGSINVHRGHFQRILENLVQNSIEAGSSKINIECKTEGSSFVLEINDNGQGIPEGIRTEIGLKQVSQGKVNGTGLGLLNAYRRIAQWGGELTLFSENNTGTRISIRMAQILESTSGGSLSV